MVENKRLDKINEGTNKSVKRELDRFITHVINVMEERAKFNPHLRNKFIKFARELKEQNIPIVLKKGVSYIDKEGARVTNGKTVSNHWVEKMPPGYPTKVYDQTYILIPEKHAFKKDASGNIRLTPEGEMTLLHEIGHAFLNKEMGGKKLRESDHEFGADLFMMHMVPYFNKEISERTILSHLSGRIGVIHPLARRRYEEALLKAQKSSEIEEIFAQTPQKRLIRHTLTPLQAERVEHVLIKNMPLFHGRRPDRPFYKRTGIKEGRGFIHIETPGIYEGILTGMARRMFKRRRLRGENA